MRTVAIYEAKARFSELLAAVQAGEEVSITKHGKPVARMVAPESQQDCQDVAAAFAKLRELGKGLELEGDIKEIIAEGRR
jgi:prevent-host-death family protein